MGRKRRRRRLQERAEWRFLLSRAGRESTDPAQSPRKWRLREVKQPAEGHTAQHWSQKRKTSHQKEEWSMASEGWELFEDSKSYSKQTQPVGLALCWGGMD